MSEDPLQAALDRIERAVGRIEAAATGGDDGRTRASPPGFAEAYALLDERHALLRLRVGETIEKLDALIAGGPAR